MPTIQNILFPVDFSPASEGTARYVQAMAGQFEAQVMLLHVVGMGEHNLAEELVAPRKSQLDHFLTEEFRYFDTERLCVAGDDAAAEIAKVARERSADLVMLPTHGLGMFRRMLIGSVTAKILNDLACPVWTSIHAETAPQLENIHCRRVLCAIDLSDRSRCVLQWAAWLASEFGAGLEIVHATADLAVPYYGSPLREEFTDTAIAEATRRIEMLRTAAEAEAEIVVHPGDPATIVAYEAKEFGADLVVIGRHAAAGLAGRLRQNAYAILRDSPCPVLSI